MSDWKKPLIPKLKDALILLGWIAALILIACLLWFFTRSIRSRSLFNAVNRVLEESGDSRRLGAPVSSGMSDSFGIGEWYTMTEPGVRQDWNSGGGEYAGGTKAFIFTFIGGGSFFPCAAVVEPGGKVKDFIPLSSHGEKMIKLVPPGVFKIYAQRIEGETL